MRKSAILLIAVFSLTALSGSAIASLGPGSLVNQSYSDVQAITYDDNFYGGAILSSSSNITIYDQIGDNDGYGYGHANVGDGANLPFTDDPSFGTGWNFDNRSAGELAATNGAQQTDFEDNLDVTFYHSFDISQFSSLTSALFTIDISGLEQGVYGYELSHLYFDGVEVLPFLNINQDTWGSGLLTYEVDLSMLADGLFEVYLDNFDGQLGDDHIAVDYTSLSVTGQSSSTIPEPATMLLFGFGLAGSAIVRKIRK